MFYEYLFRNIIVKYEQEWYIMNLLDCLKPVITLLFLSAIATLTLVAGALYIGCPIDPIVVSTSTCIVFGIYAINRFTDKEDLINDINKRLFFDNNPIILVLSILLLISSVVALIVVEKLTLFHIFIIVSGIAYSYRVIPTITKDRSLTFLRIKDILFAKSVVVSLIWGASFFAISWEIYPHAVQNPLDIILLIISVTIATFVNTNFADIRDYNGDLAFNVPTLPVRFGIKNTYLYVMLLPSVIWFLAIVALTATGTIMIPTLLFLLINLFYPLVYIWGYNKKIISEKIIEPCADGYIAVLGTGLFVLSVIS